MTGFQSKLAGMMKLIVYKVKLYNATMDESFISRRMATTSGAEMMGGSIIPESGIAIEPDQLEKGEQWTARDFKPE